VIENNSLLDSSTVKLCNDTAFILRRKAGRRLTQKLKNITPNPEAEALTSDQINQLMLNAETLKVFAESDAGIGLNRAKNAQDLYCQLGI
jgi:hypothetical protein